MPKKEDSGTAPRAVRSIRKPSRRPKDVQQMLKLAVRHHGAGRFTEAEQIYSHVLSADPENSTALHLLGVIAHQRGDNQSAIGLISKALEIAPDYADAHSNLGHVLHALGRLEEAVASFNIAVYLTPSLAEAHNNLGSVLQELGRLDDAVESYHMAVALRPDFAEAHCNNGTALQEMGHLDDALACFEQAIALRPGYAGAYAGRGGVLRELKRPAAAAASYREAIRLNPDDAGAHANLTGLYIGDLEDPESAIGGSYTSLEILRRAEFGEAREEQAISRLLTTGIPFSRLKHDVEQADYLASHGCAVDGLADFRSAGRAALDREGPGRAAAGDMVRLNRDEAMALLPYLRADCVHSMPDLPEGVLNADNDWRALQELYLNSTDEIIHIDNFLASDALAAFQEFCLASKVWPKEYANKYLGAFSDQGFISPLHLQLARELKEKMPALFGEHPLGRFWGFKYDAALGKGINVHADFALVNLNFWITPDEYNRDPDSGGLKVYDVPSPKDWRFRAYNEEKEEIYKFIESRDAQSVDVHYRCNRAVLFNSAYFHETEEIDFEDVYEGRRINITYLFGNR